MKKYKLGLIALLTAGTCFVVTRQSPAKPHEEIPQNPFAQWQYPGSHSQESISSAQLCIDTRYTSDSFYKVCNFYISKGLSDHTKIERFAGQSAFGKHLTPQGQWTFIYSVPSKVENGVVLMWREAHQNVTVFISQADTDSFGNKRGETRIFLTKDIL